MGLQNECLLQLLMQDHKKPLDELVELAHALKLLNMNPSNESTPTRSQKQPKFTRGARVPHKSLTQQTSGKIRTALAVEENIPEFEVAVYFGMPSAGNVRKTETYTQGMPFSNCCSSRPASS